MSAFAGLGSRLLDLFSAVFMSRVADFHRWTAQIGIFNPSSSSSLAPRHAIGNHILCRCLLWLRVTRRSWIGRLSRQLPTLPRVRWVNSTSVYFVCHLEFSGVLPFTSTSTDSVTFSSSRRPSRLTGAHWPTNHSIAAVSPQRDYAMLGRLLVALPLSKLVVPTSTTMSF